MSADGHTPGLLAVDPSTGEVCAPNAQGYVTVCDPTEGRRETGGYLPIDEREANARRIVACWNACDGLSTERLERLGSLDRARVELDVLRVQAMRQRDELLAALAQISDHPQAHYLVRRIARAAIARAAISKATRGAL